MHNYVDFESSNMIRFGLYWHNKITQANIVNAVLDVSAKNVVGYQFQAWLQQS